jgi:phospholipid/cholesterol/gamma-HCH transport system permease protein
MGHRTIAPPAPRRRPFLIALLLRHADTSEVELIRDIGRRFLRLTAYVGGLSVMLWRLLGTLPQILISIRLVLYQMLAMGVRSLPLIILTSVFTGAVSAWQAAYQFQNFVPMRYLGTAVGKAVVIELAPVLTALVVAGRVGASIAAELGTMRVTEQIDALEVMGIDPVRYLVMPRVVSGAVMLPVLVLFSDFIAIMGALVVAVVMVHLPATTFLNGVKLFFHMSDMYAGLFKAAIFGIIISLIGCYQGFQTRGGAEGVGRSTTGAVVIASVLILISDYLIATALFRV